MGHPPGVSLSGNLDDCVRDVLLFISSYDSYASRKTLPVGSKKSRRFFRLLVWCIFPLPSYIRRCILLGNKIERKRSESRREVEKT